ncbi:MAG TPA: hypothetical protein VD837_04415 [Terriglobales bacterium]|nr:hypothetical protein [Terriglobales bacterium]
MRRTLILAAIIIIIVGAAAAQGPPASVNSLAPGRGFAPPASVTSLGPTGFNKLPVLLGDPFPKGFHLGGKRRHPGGGFGTVFPIYVPYYVPVAPVYALPEQMEFDPTAAERRAVGSYPAEPTTYQDPRYEQSYPDRSDPAAASKPPATEAAPPSQTAAVKEPLAPEQEKPSSSFESQPETVLVFKDGHRLEITNYAIHGATLFNLSGQGPRRINIAELDVPATTKENDERGVVFRLP